MSYASSQNILAHIIYEDEKAHRGLCWWATGKDPHRALKSSLRFHLFQEVLSDCTQLEVATPSEAPITQKLCLSPSVSSSFFCGPMGGSCGAMGTLRAWEADRCGVGPESVST